MFSHAYKFNQYINFNTSNVKDMMGLFQYAQNFNNGELAGSSSSPLTLNTLNILVTSHMFNNAAAFNQQLNFDTSNIINMSSMFLGATLFNQDLSNWNVSKIPIKPDYFDTSTPAWVKEGRQPIWGTSGN
jgi:hypothetical protein